MISPNKYHLIDSLSKYFYLKLTLLNKKLTCESFKVINKDCNKAIDDFIKAVSKIPNTHFLLFVDPYSTEIHWRTMEKLLSSK